MKAASPEPRIVTRKGKPVSVIIPIEEYRELLERVEDAADIAWLRKARGKPLQYRTLGEYLATRKKKFVAF
jgi:prevent-host-death family protein